MVDGFFPNNCEILTFYAPYYSEEEDREYNMLLKPSDVDVNTLEAPVRKHPDSDEELEFDDIESQFFSFLKR